MLKHLFRPTVLGIFGLLLLATSSVSAVEIFKISNYGGASQIWFEVEDYDERNPDDDRNFALSDEPGAFGRSINSLDVGGDGAAYVRYTFDISKAGGSGGTWYFWGRVINPSNQSDFMVVEGHPGDPISVTLPVSGLVNGQRIFEQNEGPPWAWTNPNHEEAHTKTLQDGENTMYVLNRQSGAIWDVFMWTDDPDYVPTDDDYLNATMPSTGAAGSPSPGSGAADVPWYIGELTWSAGDFARTHNVYFSTNFADVNDRSATALVGEGLTEPSQAMLTELETTYYWAVDEVNGAPDFTVFAGNVWDFTVESVANVVTNVTATADSEFSADTGPGKVVNGSGLADGLHGTTETDMWLSTGLPATIQFDFDQVHSLHKMHVWNQNQLIEGLLGFSAKDVTLEVSANGTDFTAVEGVGPLSQAPGSGGYAANTTIALNGVQAMSVRMTITSGYGFIGQVGLSEVQFTSIPAFPREFDPADGDETDDLDVTLSWRAGRFAAEHRVLLSQDQAAVEDGSAVIATTAEKSHALSGLEYGSAYYTQIIDLAADGSTYAGPINLFFTPAAEAIDDMEAYADEENKEIWATWADGFDDPANGSLVGNGASGAPETDDVYEGGQSLPMEYDLTSAAMAEATQTFSPALDLTAGAPDTLGIYFKGNAAELNGFYSLNGTLWTDMSWNPQKISMSGDMLVGLALTSHAGATPATAGFSNVSTTGNVTGDWTQTDIGGTHPAGLFTEAGGTFTLSAGGADIWNAADEFRFVHKTLSGDGSITARVDSLETADAWTKGGVMIRDSAATGSSFGAVYATGTNGTRYQARLATGINAVSDTDVLDGVQQITEEPVWVRIERKTVNDGASVYLIVTDSAGRSVKVSHPDPAATLLSDWTLLSVAISDLSGINASSIRSITLGVEGAGAIGKIFADYLHVRIDNPSPETVLSGLSDIGASPGDVVTWFEAEAADVLGGSWRVVGDPLASDGTYIGSEDGDGNDNDTAPGADWIATYPFTVPVDGVYGVALRAQEAGSDSFWIRIVGATSQSHEDPDQPGTGWVRFNGIDAPDRWAWDHVHSNDHDNEVVSWTLPAGDLTLEVAKREDGTYVDAIAVLK